MEMNKRTIIFAAALVSAAIFTACNSKTSLQLEKEYILFSDTLSVNPVMSGEGYSFNVPVTSTVTKNYDRTIAVEVIDEGSTAIEGVNYRLGSNTVVIPAGKLSANVEVFPAYDTFSDVDTLSFNLKLVVPQDQKWDMYGDMHKVSMVKKCPFSIETFSGYSIVTSLFLYQYPGPNTSFERLVKTYVVEGEDNTILMKDWLFDGYDIKIKLEPSDPMNPVVTMTPGQVVSDEASVFGQILGDNRIKIEASAFYPSYFNSCQKFVALWIRAYVDNMSVPVGTVGHFYNIIQWISDEEAEKLQREGL